MLSADLAILEEDISKCIKMPSILVSILGAAIMNRWERLGHSGKLLPHFVNLSRVFSWTYYSKTNTSWQIQGPSFPNTAVASFMFARNFSIPLKFLYCVQILHVPIPCTGIYKFLLQNAAL